MIRRETIDGREATVAFVDDKMNPVDEDKATMVRVVFDDGMTAWARLDGDEAEDGDVEEAGTGEVLGEHEKEPEEGAEEI